MRIAFVGQKGFPATWGGVEVHVDAIAKRLARRGHDVTVYARRWYSPSTETDTGVRVRLLPTMPGKHGDAGVHSLLCSFDAIFRGYDIVHYHGVGPALFCWLPRLARRKVVTTVHALDYEREKWGGVARAALRGGERAAFCCGQRTLVVSRALGDHFGAQGRDVTVLPNAVEVPEPRPARGIRSRFGLQGDDYLLSLGRWTPAKRIPEMIAAFRALAPAGVRFVVAGGDEQPEQDGVVFPGTVTGDLKAELFSNALGFVSLSSLEGLPIALLEAMSYGRACLASDIEGHRELLDGCGLLRPAETQEERVAALRELVGLAPEERAELGRLARERVRADYAWDEVVDRLEEIYAGLA